MVRTLDGKVGATIYQLVVELPVVFQVRGEPDGTNLRGPVPCLRESTRLKPCLAYGMCPINGGQEDLGVFGAAQR